MIATAVFLYVCMDGFDLGLGILFPVVHGKEDRDVMVNTVAPVWDGNETWLVLGGGGGALRGGDGGGGGAGGTGGQQRGGQRGGCAERERGARSHRG